MCNVMQERKTEENENRKRATVGDGRGRSGHLQAGRHAGTTTDTSRPGRTKRTNRPEQANTHCRGHPSAAWRPHPSPGGRLRGCMKGVARTEALGDALA